MGLGFGLLSAQLRPGETSWARAYADTVELARTAERLGYDSIWTTEHHFIDDGYMPSLLVVSAALAAATSRIGIGTGVLLAPLHNPLRLAEDAATVQLLSDNRLTLGLGLGWNQFEFDAFEADISRRGRAMEEFLAFLPRAWSGEVFRHDGAVYQFPELAVRPTPDAAIPVVVGGSVERAIRRAARLADGIFSNAPIRRFLGQVEWARDELAAQGSADSDFRWIHYSILLPGSDPDAVWDEMKEHVWQMSWKYGDMLESSTRWGPPPAAPRLSGPKDEALRSRTVIAGPGEHIVERLLEIRETAGVPVEFVARSYFPTLELEEQVELMEQLAEEVLPHL